MLLAGLLNCLVPSSKGSGMDPESTGCGGGGGSGGIESDGADCSSVVEPWGWLTWL